MANKVLSLLLAAMLMLALPLSLSACGSKKSSSMTSKQAADAAYAKKLHDSIPDAYGK